VHETGAGGQDQPQPEPSTPVDMRAWSLDLIRRSKWTLWHGQHWKTQAHLEDLCGWCAAKRAQAPRTLAQPGKAARDLWGYLETNRDSLPHYGKRYRTGLPISTAFTEFAVNEVVAKRVNKNQPMRWNRYTVQPFLTVRVHVLRRHPGRGLPGHTPVLPATEMPGNPHLSVPQLFMLPLKLV
jgi:hypothetical protein